jgi:hypothetical protein
VIAAWPEAYARLDASLKAAILRNALSDEAHDNARRGFRVFVGLALA